MADLNDFSDQYNTALTPQQEQQFRAAYPDPHDLYDYDLRGAWLASAGKAANGHLPDTYKKPNHPTFSTESQYSGKDGYMGGTWAEGKGKKWLYTASPTNMKFRTAEQMNQYFKMTEPDADLLLAPIAPKEK
jgi:hypothetical protein